ncbi:MAG TPA: hypothetical protein PK358_10685 [Spirochaetota bacterium]|nr:hypothetical protein [Spirochaetota bacterium]HPJ35292.1 hypothetical protein [Spirochaetota bacterium]
MTKRYSKKLSECITCSKHVMQTSGSVICGYFDDSYRELPLTLCDDPALDYIGECPMLMRNARDMKLQWQYRPRERKAAARLKNRKYTGELVKLFG